MLSMGKSTISMAIFNSYVKLPEGKPLMQKNGWWGWWFQPTYPSQKYDGVSEFVSWDDDIPNMMGKS